MSASFRAMRLKSGLFSIECAVGLLLNISQCKKVAGA